MTKTHYISEPFDTITIVLEANTIRVDFIHKERLVAGIQSELDWHEVRPGFQISLGGLEGSYFPLEAHDGDASLQA